LHPSTKLPEKYFCALSKIMALFGKKTTTKEAPPEQQAASTDDFSPEALAALAESLDSGEANVQAGSALQVRKPVSFKNGSVLGVNIGADTMKAVELTAKNGSCTVTGLAIAPTPPDSIANGVVMSVNVLADAVKELIAPFKTKKVVTSVAGTGEVIVRVIEVPTMTDAELQENMTTDLDRYIPFPPSEVQWDAAAMRDLPVDPNATNMDVLLVAARHELIDLHLQLLSAVKVDPKAIDVEPLAAARALSGPLSENSTHVDYNDVVAVLDIGASSTEISILRGDELVFTRTVPVAGNTMTQALMDKLNLPHTDAERLKREKGDASPAQDTPTASTNVATINENTDVAQSDASTGFDDIILPDEPPAEISSAPADTPEESSDPFDLDLFNQGPTQSEPGEQHQQKMPDSTGDDDDASQLPSKNSDSDVDAEIDSDDTALPSKAEASHTPPAEPTTGGAIASFFDFDENELDEQSEQLPTIEGKPQHTEAPPHEEEETGTIDWDDDSFLPSVAATETTDATLPSAFTFPDEESPTPAAPAGGAAVEPVAIPEPQGFSLDSGTPAPTAEEKSTLPPVTEEAPAEKAPVEDIDLSDILGDTSESTPALGIDEGLGGTIALDEGIGLGDSLADLGTGLDVEEKPHDEVAVHAVLKPILDDLTSELRRSLEYHSARYPDAPVKRIVLVGGGAKLHNLDKYFSQNLGVPAIVGNPLQSLTTDSSQVNPQLIKEHGNAFVVALGLAMREIIR
jgi:type IV pilus assembly protein PilM